jgi:hypothetical protein
MSTLPSEPCTARLTGPRKAEAAVGEIVETTIQTVPGDNTFPKTARHNTRTPNSSCLIATYSASSWVPALTPPRPRHRSSRRETFGDHEQKKKKLEARALRWCSADRQTNQRSREKHGGVAIGVAEPPATPHSSLISPARPQHCTYPFELVVSVLSDATSRNEDNNVRDAIASFMLAWSNIQTDTTVNGIAGLGTCTAQEARGLHAALER